MGDKKTVLFIRPLGRVETYYTYHWLEPLIDYARGLGWNVIDLADEQAIRRNVEDALVQYDPELVIGAGHGFKYSFLGDGLNSVLDKNNSDLLAGRTVYLLSCWIGGGLGKLVAENGGSFIGWNIPISWVLTDEAPHPYNDVRARVIQDVNEIIARRLLEGMGVEGAHRDAVDLFGQWADYWRYEASGDPRAQEIVDLTIFDKEGLVAYEKSSLRNVEAGSSLCPGSVCLQEQPINPTVIVAGLGLGALVVLWLAEEKKPKLITFIPLVVSLTGLMIAYKSNMRTT